MNRLLSFLLLISAFALNKSEGSYDCIKHCACEKKGDVVTADCRGLNYTEIPLPNPKYRVNVLYLQFNRIARLREGELLTYESLTELYVQGNRIDTIESGAFDGITRLQKLDISMNMISKIPDNELQKLPNLVRLSISMNALRKIPEGVQSLTKLVELDLSNNRFIADVPTGSLPTSLVKLDMRFTGISLFKKASFDSLIYMKTLLLSDNMASGSVDFEAGVFNGLVSLEYMDMSRCFCRRLPVDSFTKLKFLNTLLMNNCRLEKLPIFARSTPIPNTVFKKRRKRSLTTPTNTTMRPISATPPSTKGAIPYDSATTPPSDSIWYNPHLTLLDLSNNRRMTVRGQDVRFPSSLTELRLGCTHVPLVDENLFNETTAIQKLDLCHSKLQTIARDAFMKFNNVSEICLSGNPLDGAPRLPASLLHLNLSETKITNLTRVILGELSNVMEANIRSGNIEWIEDNAFGNMTALRMLDLSENKIDTLTANALTIGTFEFNFTANMLVPARHRTRRSTDEEIGRRSNLIDLNLSGNLMRIIQRGAFSSHSQLRNLDLHANFLQILQSGTFAGLKSLVTLLLGMNSITDVTSNAFADLDSLEVLELGQNRIEVIHAKTFDGLASLKRLNLGGNSILLIHAFASASLEYLDISSNNLTVFPRVEGANVREIIASDNEIEHFEPGALDFVPNLQNFNIRDCHISYLNYTVFQGTSDLRHLNLRGNYITNLPDVELKSLEVLELAENELSEINFKLNDAAPSIQRLDLQYNKIASLSPDVFYGSVTLKQLDLSGNNFQCDCYLQPLVAWIEKNVDNGPVEVVDAESYLCDGPAEKYAEPVLVAVQELNCQPAKPSKVKRAEIYIGISIAALLVAVVMILLIWSFIAKSRRRSRRRENGSAMLNEDGGNDAAVVSKGCCDPCKQWCLGMYSYRRDRGHRGRAESEERRDLMIASPVTSPTSGEPPTSL